MSSRLLIVSNRLPVTVRVEEGQLSVNRSPGGLATGLKGPHERSGGAWIGWPGDVEELDEGRRTELEARLAELRFVPIQLTRTEIAHYYTEFSNGVIWPLFHYLLDRVPVDALHWETYRQVNERFAEVVAAQYQPGDLIWVQDYHLTLLPDMLRQRLPDARIGFFLHIPFPSSEVFRILPWREELLRGMLGADLIGFHTYSYARHFGSALLRILGVEPQVDEVWFEGRNIRLSAFPIGIDAAHISSLASTPEIDEAVARLRAENPDQRLVLGVDRLDYTKGIPRRLMAFERLLERQPDLLGRVRLIQVGVPTRTDNESYVEFHKQVMEIVSRINGRFSTVSWTPITWLYRSFAEEELITMYRAADVMLVTPLRDGMNLVAKEFVASRVQEDGVLVLSEFAGAATELGEALVCNPYDLAGMASNIQRALEMPAEEQRTRMAALRQRVLTYDVYHWADTFLWSLEHQVPEHRPRARRLSTRAQLEEVASELRAAERRVLLLDYDGTLVPFAMTPQLARPDPALLDLLRRLAEQPGNELHVVSGRSSQSLEAWLGDLPIGLYAEHGFWARSGPGEGWTSLEDPSILTWKEKVREILEGFAERTPGSFVEEKTAALVWHYRAVDPEFGALLAKELRLHLAEVLSNMPVEVIPGNRIVEVRQTGVSKGGIVHRLLARQEAPGILAAIGDDRTDEDMFRALPAESYTFHVGPGATVARFRLPDHRVVRQLLELLAAPRT